MAGAIAYNQFGLLLNLNERFYCALNMESVARRVKASRRQSALACCRVNANK